MKSMLAVLLVCGAGATAAQAYPPFFMPMAPMMAPQIRMMHPAMMAGRPSAPQVDASKPDSKEIDSQQGNAQIGSSLGVESALSTMNQMGIGAAKNMHNYFVPPYSWGWKLGMMGASTVDPRFNYFHDVPAYLNLISGYFAGAPDAMKYVHAVEDGGLDPFTLPTKQPAVQLAIQPSMPVRDPQANDPVDGEDAPPPVDDDDLEEADAQAQMPSHPASSGGPDISSMLKMAGPMMQMASGGGGSGGPDMATMMKMAGPLMGMATGGKGDGPDMATMMKMAGPLMNMATGSGGSSGGPDIASMMKMAGPMMNLASGHGGGSDMANIMQMAGPMMKMLAP